MRRRNTHKAPPRAATLGRSSRALSRGANARRVPLCSKSTAPVPLVYHLYTTCIPLVYHCGACGRRQNRLMTAGAPPLLGPCPHLPLHLPFLTRAHPLCLQVDNVLTRLTSPSTQVPPRTAAGRMQTTPLSASPPGGAGGLHVEFSNTSQSAQSAAGSIQNTWGQRAGGSAPMRQVRQVSLE
eukprot:8367290-Pyramimonas_sp.AAC.1